MTPWCALMFGLSADLDFLLMSACEAKNAEGRLGLGVISHSIAILSGTFFPSELCIF